MIAYKGFNKDLTCTMGKGTYQYQIGQTYKEDKAQCVSTGFHCCEEPIQVLKWYRGDDSRYCIVDIRGDIHEDGTGRTSCTEMTILKEITLAQLGILECRWLVKHHDRQESSLIKKNKGIAVENEIVIVRGKNPKAAGKLGSTLFLVKEKKRSRQIEQIYVFEIDGKEYLPDVYYMNDGSVAN